MKLLTASFLAALTFAPAVVLAAAAPQPPQTEGEVSNRHKLYAVNELSHYRLFEQTTHPKLFNQGNFIIGGGQKGDRHSHPIRLDAGADYLVMVTCDEDCFDVNLRVYDASNKLVGEDTKMPAVDSRIIVAQVQLVPAATQIYRLEVQSYCREGSIGACSYAIGVNMK